MSSHNSDANLDEDNLAPLSSEEAFAEERFTFNCNLNGKAISTEIPPSRRLLKVIREDLELTGDKTFL